jgi:hypothetical protein
MTYGSQTWTMTIKEINTLRIFERGIVRKIHEPVKEGEPCRTITNNDINDTLQGQDIVKFIKSLYLRWYGQLKECKSKTCHNKLQHLLIFACPCIIV